MNSYCKAKNIRGLKILSYCTIMNNHHFMILGKHVVAICDRACENRACGLKYTMSFDETYLNAKI